MKLVIAPNLLNARGWKLAPWTALALLVLPGCARAPDPVPAVAAPMMMPVAAAPAPAPAPEGATPAEAPGQAKKEARTGFFWNLDDCALSYVMTPVDDAKLWPHVPDGFRLLSPEDLGLPLGALGDAVLFVFLGFCTETTSDFGSVAGAAFATYGTFVEPRPEFRIEGVTHYFIFWDVLVADERLRGALLEAGLPVRAGAIGGDDAPVPLSEPVFHYDLAFEGEGTQEVFGVAPVPGDSDSTPHAAYMATKNGLARWELDHDIPITSSGAGSWSYPAGSLPAQVIGDTECEGVAGTEHGSIHARITVLSPE